MVHLPPWVVDNSRQSKMSFLRSAQLKQPYIFPVLRVRERAPRVLRTQGSAELSVWLSLCLGRGFSPGYEKNWRQEKYDNT